MKVYLLSKGSLLRNAYTCCNSNKLSFTKDYTQGLTGFDSLIQGQL